MTGLAEVWIGTSGYVYRHWRKGVFYPPGSPPARSSATTRARFRTVELNNPFYRLPTAEMFERWRDSTPPDFQFAVKASRYITHIKRLRNVARGAGAVSGTRAITSGRSSGPSCSSFPQRSSSTWLGCDEFLALLLPGPPLGDRIPAPELAHPRGVPAADRSRRRALHSGRRRTHPDRITTAPFTYIRMHRGQEPEGGFTEEELSSWAAQIRALRAPARRCTSTSTTIGEGMRYEMR